jgi:hypothetical protein
LRFGFVLRRRGATVVLVLGLLAVTLAVSYAMMRTQVTSLQIQTNLNRRDDARQAALTGMTTALRRIHESDWEGVDSTVSGAISNDASYEVTFATGDASLQPDEADYEEYPFRLTLTSTGYAFDTNDPGRRSEYRVQAVVELVRRAFASQPSAWTSLEDYTLVQWADEETTVQFPARIDGSARLGGRLAFCEEYPDHTPSLDRYLSDLEQMRQAGLGDYRPFGGPLSLPFDRTTGSTLSLLSGNLNVTLVDAPRGGSAPVSHPGALSSYRLYPGGKEYEIPVIQSLHGYELSGVTLAPDPIENPLGVFRSQGYLRFRDNVTIQGSIITDGFEPDIDVSGVNIAWSSAELPRLEGQAASETVHLPAALVMDDFRVDSGARMTLNGALVVWDELEVEERTSSTSFSMEGRVLADEFAIRGRSSWKLNSTIWSALLYYFNLNLDSTNPELYFPRWLEANFGMQAAPKITFRPGAATATHHWQDWSQPVYATQATDEGLIWDLLSWSESQE